jgi:hypothetical protein
MRTLLLCFGCAVLLAACDTPTSPSSLRRPRSEPSVAKPSPPASPAPSLWPSYGFGEPFTVLTPGASVRRRVEGHPGSNENPQCVDPTLPGWGCQFFRVTPSFDGTLDLTLTWVLETQPNQGLDLSLDDDQRRSWWSDRGPGPSPTQLLSLPLDAGETYQITIWYTFRGVEFELRTGFTPR